MNEHVITFQNREGLLPSERSGFYSEYTVQTPGSSDRGARRIIEGQDGVLYYTDDHYDSFSVVVRQWTNSRLTCKVRISFP